MRYREIKAEITEIIAVCSEIYVKHVDAFWGRKVELLLLNLLVHKKLALKGL
jgi:hypothetical protein